MTDIEFITISISVVSIGLNIYFGIKQHRAKTTIGPQVKKFRDKSWDIYNSLNEIKKDQFGQNTKISGRIEELVRVSMRLREDLSKFYDKYFKRPEEID